jgi:hypothetical protein
MPFFRMQSLYAIIAGPLGSATPPNTGFAALAAATHSWIAWSRLLIFAGAADATVPTVKAIAMHSANEPSLFIVSSISL